LEILNIYDDTGVSPEIVLSDLSANQYFSDRHMRWAQHYASVVAFYGNEDTIKSGAHLKWFDTEPEYYYDYNDDSFINEADTADAILRSWVQLWTPDKSIFYGSIEWPQFDTPQNRERREQAAIQSQLSDFQAALASLENTAGLLYFIQSEMPYILIDNAIENETLPLQNIIHANVRESSQLVEFFRSQPVYYFLTADISSIRTEQSFGTDHSHTHNPAYSNNVTIYLAFSHEFVAEQRNILSVTRDAYVRNLSVIAPFVVLILGLTIILLVSAGRKYKVAAVGSSSADRIHISLLDKPYLDISLAAIIGWTVFIVYMSLVFVSRTWHNLNYTAINILFAVVSLLIVPPVLYWLMSFSKRVKIGRFWRHTLVYAIIYSCIFGSLRFLFRAAKSLWAGTRLTLRVALISIATFFIMFFVGLIGAESRDLGVLLLVIVLFTTGITVLLLMYARRIRNLEQGARAASEGKYDIPIMAGGGELGSIAASINNISAGINTAVEERMKSERLKTELITNVSHDIRTPLTSIITYTDLLDHEGLDCEKAPEYLEVLKQKSLRLKTLTEELFEAAKAATGNIDVNLTELDVVSLINQVLGELDSAVKSSGLDLRVNLPEKLLAKADGRLMQRVIENLLSNVFKYSLPGSRVYLDAYQTDNSQVRIDLKNISSQELNFNPSELTERFKRGDESRADGGSGLGLSIVQSFMDAQGGKFEVSIDGDLFKATVLLPTPHLTPAMPNT